ncbi:MAG: peptidase C13 [Proteobacteria bacterium]|nr:peptidase C13 [Pseudomonadota bacterium]
MGVVGAALADGARAALLRPTFALPATGSWAALLAIVALGLVIPLALQAHAADGYGAPTFAGVPGTLLPVPLALIAVAAVALPYRRADGVLATATIVLSAALMIGVVLTLAAYVLDTVMDDAWRGPFGWIAARAAPVWLAVAAAVACARRWSLDGRGLLWALAVGLGVIAAPLASDTIDRTLWRTPPDAAAVARYRAMQAVVSENVLYAQPRVLQAALDGLDATATAGGGHAWFVGVAGYAEQDVFMREIDRASALFRERYATEGRSIELVNNPATLATRPLATRTSLAWALERIGERMNADRDVLILFLTSHGTHDHRFILSFPPLALYDLTPTDLRGLLDRARIRNRVVVVSACYSGGFVDALRDPHTLVITAAAKDRSSFGCSNDADATWFGHAFFDEALRRTDSFTAAFADASAAIATREKAAGYEPSQPQIDVGADIGGVLAALARPAAAR